MRLSLVWRRQSSSSVRCVDEDQESVVLNRRLVVIKVSIACGWLAMGEEK